MKKIDGLIYQNSSRIFWVGIVGMILNRISINNIWVGFVFLSVTTIGLAIENTKAWKLYKQQHFNNLWDKIVFWLKHG